MNNDEKIRMLSYHRVNHCWSCQEHLDNNIHSECPFCKWIICPKCGAYSFDCLFSKLIGRDTELRLAVRDYLKETTNIEERELKQIIEKERQIQKEHHLSRARAELMEKMQSTHLVYHNIHGKGTIVKLCNKNGTEKIIVAFKNGEKTFNFPETFTSGSMTFAENDHED